MKRDWTGFWLLVLFIASMAALYYTLSWEGIRVPDEEVTISEKVAERPLFQAEAIEEATCLDDLLRMESER